LGQSPFLHRFYHIKRDHYEGVKEFPEKSYIGPLDNSFLLALNDGIDGERLVFSLIREQSHAEPLRLLPRQIRSGAAPPSVEELLLTEMRRSAQSVAAVRARQAEKLVRLSLGGQLERAPLRRRAALCLMARAP
jgi:hypothetical protein